MTSAARFRAGGRTYTDSPAGRLLAAKDKAADKAQQRGHRMMHWTKHTQAGPPRFTARCGTCGAGVIVVTGRAPRNDPAHPGSRKMVRLGRIDWCPGTGRRS